MQGLSTETLGLSSGILSSTGSNIYINGLLIAGNAAPFAKSATIEYPAVNDNITLFRTYNRINVIQLNSVLIGVQPSGLFSVRFDPSKLAVGTELLTNGFSVTGNNTGDNFISFSNPTINANNWVWLRINGTGGTAISGLNVTMFYNNI